MIRLYGDSFPKGMIIVLYSNKAKTMREQSIISLNGKPPLCTVFYLDYLKLEMLLKIFS